MFLIDNQAPMPLGHDPVTKAAMARLELARTELRTQALDLFAFIAVYAASRSRTRSPPLIRRMCCQLHQGGVFPFDVARPASLVLSANIRPQPGASAKSVLQRMAPGEGLEPSLSDFRDRDRLAFCRTPQCGRGESNSQDARFKRAMSARCITPQC